MEGKSIFAGASGYAVNITKRFDIDEYGFDEGELNIEITDKLITVEGNFTGGGYSGVKARIKMTTDEHVCSGNGVNNEIEIENVEDCQCFQLESTPDEGWKHCIKSLKFKVIGTWESCAMIGGLRIVLETMQEVVAEAIKWK